MFFGVFFYEVTVSVVFFIGVTWLFFLFSGTPEWRTQRHEGRVRWPLGRPREVSLVSSVESWIRQLQVTEASIKMVDFL